jgi:hypothetical protein
MSLCEVPLHEIKAYGRVEAKRSSTHSKPPPLMVCGHIQTPPALLPGKEIPAPTEKKNEKAPETSRTPNQIS